MLVIASNGSLASLK